MTKHILLDTADFGDAICTGRGREENVCDSEPGLRIAYEFKNGEPRITLTGEDGEIVFFGLSEIRHAVEALWRGRAAAQNDVKKSGRQC